MSNKSYIVIDNETDEQVAKLNEFLDNNNFEYRREYDALNIYADEIYDSIEVTAISSEGGEIPQEDIRISFRNHIADMASKEESHWIDTYSYW